MLKYCIKMIVLVEYNAGKYYLLSIVYENNNTWVLYDGVPETINKSSTNGLW